MCLRILIKSEPVGQFLSFEAAIDGDADEAVKRLHAHYQRTADIILNSESDLLAD